MAIQKNLITLCFATVFTLGLAACGGGGGGGAPPSDMDGGDTMVPTIVGKVFPDGTTFTLPADLVDDTTVSVEEGVTVPVGDVGTFECVTGPCTVDIADDVVTTTGVIKVVSLADDLPAEVLTALADVAEDAPAGPTPEAETKAVGTKAKVIGKVMPDNMALADPLSVTVTAKRSGPEIKVEGEDDFTHVMGPMYTLVHDADDDGNVVQEIVLVDHTITAPKARSFESQHPLDLSTDTTNDGVENQADDDTFEALLVGDTATTAPAPEVLKLVMSDAFVAGAGTTTDLAFDSDDDGSNTKNEAYEASGTYDGASGTYQCNAASGTDCTVQLTRDAKGKVSITLMSSGWIFTPDEKAKVYVVDTEYASYGVWLKRTTDADGVLTYNMVDTFAMGTEATVAVTEVDGTASYKAGLRTRSAH